MLVRCSQFDNTEREGGGGDGLGEVGIGGGGLRR